MGRRGRPRHPDILTPRQWEVLALLCDGLSNPEIADRLGISRDGVKFHVSEILTKLGVGSREEAATWREERRPWWAMAVAPFALLWRRVGWAAGGAVLVAALAGVGVMAVLLWRGGSPARPHHELAYLDASGSLWLVDAETGSTRKLADDGSCGQFSSLEWSATGKVLACIGPGVRGTSATGRIVLRDATGAVVGQINEPGLTDMHWSPAGGALVYGASVPGGTAARRYRIADASGRQIADLGVWELTGVQWWGWAAYVFPFWSPDGDELAYRPNGDVPFRVYSLVSGDRETRASYYPLAWAANGAEHIVATDYRQPASQGALPTYHVTLTCRHCPSGLGQRLPALDNGVQFWVTPGGQHVVHVTRDQRSDGLPGLGVLDLNSGDATPIPNSLITAGTDSIPAEWVTFSRDGKYVYWQGGDRAAYRAKIDGTGLTKLLALDQLTFTWSPDHEMIMYTRFEAASTSLLVADGDGRNPKVIASREGTGSPIAAAWRP